MVAVYCRVSTDDQADAKTIENQVVFAQEFCRLHGLSIYGFYKDDGVSGSVPVEKRPAGSRLLADAREGFFEVVYVYRLDRLARTTLDILRTHQKLSEMDVALKSMTENFDTSTPSGKFFMTTLGGIAEIERETIAERMRMGKSRALKEGRWPGGPPPYGYSLAEKKLVINQKESDIVRMIFRLYIQGEMSTASIADYLNAIGVPSPEKPVKGVIVGGGRWYRSRIWSIIKNMAYCGSFMFGRRGKNSLVLLECPPVVSVKQWKAAQEECVKKSYSAQRNSKREYLLKGLIKCVICGRSFCGDGSTREGRHSYYRCTGSTSFREGSIKCRSKFVRADLLEGIVWADLESFLVNSDQVLNLLKKIVSNNQKYTEDQSELLTIEKSLFLKEKQRRKIVQLFCQNILSEEEIRKELLNLSRQLDILKKRKAEINDLDSEDSGILEIKEQIHKKLSAASFSERRELVRGLIDSIKVDTVIYQGKLIPRVFIAYVFEGSTDCALRVETRGKYRLGIPKSPY